MPSGKMYTKNFSRLGLVSAKWWLEKIISLLLKF
jgi:hypothetical protein